MCIRLCVFYVHKCVYVICMYIYVSIFECFSVSIVYVFVIYICLHVCFNLCIAHVTFLCVNLGLKSICILMNPYDPLKFKVCSFSITVVGIPSCMSELSDIRCLLIAT